MFEDEAVTGPDSALDGEQPVQYSATIEGLDEDPDIREIARAVANVFTLQDRGAPSVAGLERRAEQDIELILRVLTAEAYYDATVEARVVPDGADRQRVIFDVETGPLYRIGEVRIDLVEEGENKPEQAALVAASKLEAGTPARGEAIVEAEAAVVVYLQRNGFPDADFVDRKAVAQKDDATLDVTSTFNSGPFVTFGNLDIDPESSLEPDYIRGLIPWKEGETYNQKKVDEFQSSLKSTGLFDTVSIRPAETAGSEPDGSKRDLALKVENGKQRSVGGSLRYDTDQGPGVRLFWRHRNLFGEAEDFRAEADASLDEQKLTFGITRPRSPSARWTSSESLTLRRLDDDAFEEESATVRKGLDQKRGAGWTIGGSIEASASLVETDFSDDTAYLLGLPLYVKRDRTNDPLDATRGYRFVLNAGPYVGLNNGEFIQFGVIGGGGSVYFPLIGENRLVLAMRTQVTSIPSRNLDDIPVNQRLFAGGGASVRGYEFQSISPTNNANDLTGGRFLNENSIEFRLRLGESFGVVAFADTGLVEEEPFPSFAEKLNVGVGGGFRYYSPVGPIRFDLAFPLDRRNGDNIFEFYISLGQSF
ncbi:autotransporter assembly complex protein TamA [Minwuia sp.]|uniref:autotransporter assembly complex protein TamA n=1 Tax=Minwuia sp. TaxID=2493630 RepID=UPI003A8C89B0